MGNRSEQSAFECLTVEQIMEKHVQSAHDKTNAEDLASFMTKGFGSVPIVDQQQRLVGIVSEYDLLTALGEVVNGTTFLPTKL